MYFNSYEFIFLFLPVAVGGYFLLGATEKSGRANIWLFASSLFFYGYWEAENLPILLFSIGVNFIVARRILRAVTEGDDKNRKRFFVLGLLFNVALLGWYKYADFILANVNAFFCADLPLPHNSLPLGISFFTITQLLCLYDCQAGTVKKNGFLNYALFVSFFPHLLAGPILYHRSMMRQFQNETLRKVNWENMAEGLTLFVVGLLKKVVIADSFITYVNGGFANSATLTFFHAWLVSLCYMVQLYYDFSGYSDMAIGMAKMLNITIPINFNSPAKATNLIEFWQRWHISLTNAITGCLYQPMLRSFAKPTFRHVVFVSFVTFFIIGIWHGAGWTYVTFALLHAFGIVANHLWRRFGVRMSDICGRVLTVAYLAVTQVFFRATDMREGLNMVEGMIGLHGVLLPEKIVALVEKLFGVTFAGGHILLNLPYEILLPATFLMYMVPTSTKLVKKIKPTRTWAAILVVSFLYSVSRLGDTTDFLYFQF